MKTLIAAGALAASALAAAPALAQDGHAAHAAAAANAHAGLSVETTPIETIAADPQGKAVLDKELPGLTSHEAYDQFKGMTLVQLAPMSQGAITDEKLKAIQADLDQAK